MANEGFGVTSTVQTIALNGGSQTSTAANFRGADYAAVYAVYTHGNGNITAFDVQVSDDSGTTWVDLPTAQRGSGNGGTDISVSENWRVVVPGAPRASSTPRQVRFAVTSGDSTGTLAFKVRFNRRPVPVMVS